MHRSLVMGVLNVTPDSFSDGGRYLGMEAALAHGRELVRQGADVVDIGGESTRPGAVEVDPREELHRVLPVIRGLADSVRLSVDTRHPEVAEQAVAAGASILNDVTASDEVMEVAGWSGCGYVAMHMQGEPGTMQEDPRYDDVVGEVHDFLAERAAAAANLGCSEIWVDPGIGFGKTIEHNLALLGTLPELVGAGMPVLVGASRKGFLGALTGGAAVDDRLEASVAVAAWAFSCGVDMVRVHDVAETVDARAKSGRE